MSAISWLKKRPIAHRGFHDMNKARWENTLPAFAAAAERGYAIECDVQLSADGEVVDRAVRRELRRGQRRPGEARKRRGQKDRCKTRDAHEENSGPGLVRPH